MTIPDNLIDAAAKAKCVVWPNSLNSCAGMNYRHHKCIIAAAFEVADDLRAALSPRRS